MACRRCRIGDLAKERSEFGVGWATHGWPGLLEKWGDAGLSGLSGLGAGQGNLRLEVGLVSKRLTPVSKLCRFERGSQLFVRAEGP
jgi:hypothetical protein